MKSIFALLPALAFCNRLLSQQIDSATSERFTLHFQSTVINQFKPSFSAPYSGSNSLKPEKENRLSVTSTLYLGMRLWTGASIFLNPEVAGGSGLSEVKGIAAATNGETFRIGDPAPKLYLARLFYRQIFSLTKTYTRQANDFNQLRGNLPSKFLSLTIGKLSMADFFDNCAYSHDPRQQFMCWALMDNGAWDYPANTRGYTEAAVLEYITERFEIRYAFSEVPTFANGNQLNQNINKANSQTLEFVHRHHINNRVGALRHLGFYTTANMGNYKASLLQLNSVPVIENTRAYGRTKYGFALNAEQALSAELGAFAKASWNDGANETWAFTEIDKSFCIGLVLHGNSWKRKNDHVGIATVASGLSANHRAYLKAGGLGFMLGDGSLKYAPEHVTELYYCAALCQQQLFFTAAYQVVVNPGYNANRKGPVQVFSVRLHARI